MTATPPTTPVPPAPPRARSRTLVVLLWAVSGGVLLQALLAGLFLSVSGGARLAHVIVGALLPWLALVGAIVAAVQHRRGRCSPRLAIAIYPLPVVLYLQEVLGHLPFPVTTAIHVPLGVLLAVYSVVLALAATQRPAPPVRPLAATPSG